MAQNKEMTELELITLGFECKSKYGHDQYQTTRYEKGIISVEFTYEGDELKTVDLTIPEANIEAITIEEIKILTPILGKCSK